MARQFSTDQLNKALFDFEDLMERCLSPFLLLKDTAACINSRSPLTGSEITVGIKATELTPMVLSTINTYCPNRRETTYGFDYEVEGVPVRVYVINRKYKFLAHPNKVFYWGGDYLLPNPFDQYYKSRFIVR